MVNLSNSEYAELVAQRNSAQAALTRLVEVADSETVKSVANGWEEAAELVEAIEQAKRVLAA